MAMRTNGGCGYCKEKGHLAPICYYLADELPDGWKPDPEKHLWCYFLSKQYKEKRAKENSQPTLQAKEELTPPSTLAVSEDHAIEFHFSPFQGLALPLDELDDEKSSIKKSATEKVDPEETEFYLIAVTDDTGTIADNEVTMSNEEFIGREPDFVGTAVQSSVIGKWISDTGSANTAVGNLDKKPLTPKPTSAPKPLIMSNTIPFGFQVDEKPQREQCLIEDTQKPQHSNLLVETDEDCHENLLQEQEPCDEETLAREPSSEIPPQPPEALQSSPTQVSQRPNKGIPPERQIRDEQLQATWENKARTFKSGTES